MWINYFAGAAKDADPAAAAGNKPGAKVQPGADPAAEEEQEEEVVSSELNDVMTTLLPWMTSILFHLGLVVLALFLVWSVIESAEEEMPIIPVAKLSDNPGGSLQKTENVELQNTQNVRQVQSQDVATEESLQNLDSSTQSKLELIGASGGGGGGKLAPFGTTSGAGSGIGANFYGTGGNAKRIVYIVDASGSLIAELPFVINELKRSINELGPKQEFAVIFFQNDQAIEAPPTRMKFATPENKKKVQDWITLEAGNIVPQGQTNPMAAIQLAMRYNPELVFILSDNITGSGKYEVNRVELLKVLDEANKDRKIKINTIQFLYPDSLNTLQEIASVHGGIYKFIKESDLGLE